jgi:hypothetical protein
MHKLTSECPVQMAAIDSKCPDEDFNSQLRQMEPVAKATDLLIH